MYVSIWLLMSCIFTSGCSMRSTQHHSVCRNRMFTQLSMLFLLHTSDCRRGLERKTKQFTVQQFKRGSLKHLQWSWEDFWHSKIHINMELNYNLNIRKYQSNQQQMRNKRNKPEEFSLCTSSLPLLTSNSIWYSPDFHFKCIPVHLRKSDTCSKCMFARQVCELDRQPQQLIQQHL